MFLVDARGAFQQTAVQVEYVPRLRLATGGAAQNQGNPVSYTHLDVYKRQELVVIGIEGGSGQRCVVSLRPADSQPAPVGVLRHRAGTGRRRFLVDAAQALNHFPFASGKDIFLHRSHGALIPLSLNGRHLVAFLSLIHI